jgi:CubicO group peptidase (beta-lactamase class C family)
MSSTGTHGASETAELYFPPPGETWEPVPHPARLWDPPALEDLLAYCATAKSTGLVVLQHGRIAVERYWGEGGVHEAADCFSAQKSLVALLAGLARHEGRLDLDAPVTRYLRQGWSRSPATEPAISVRHLMTMTSGLTNRLDFAAEPGRAWAYNTPAYQLLKTVIENATGEPFAQYTRSRVWDPIGAEASCWEQRANMPFTGWVASTRDMARFGLLVLAGGRWGQRIVFPDPNFLASCLDSSQALNPAYGYLWWLNGKREYVQPRGARHNGPMVPAAPSDMVMAAGAGDKRIYVVPSLGLVAVRHGAAAGEDAGDVSTGFDNQFWTRFARAFKP